MPPHAELSQDRPTDGVDLPHESDRGWGRSTATSGRVTSVTVRAGGRGPAYPSVNLGSRVATRLGSIVSLATIFALIVGVPVALAVFVGWPLPHEVPTMQQVSDAFERQGVPLEVIINGLAIVVWIAWAQLAWAIGAETMALVHGRVAGRARVWPGAQMMARALVASAALVVSSLGGVQRASAVPLSALQELEQPEDPSLRSADPGFVVPEAPPAPAAPTGSTPSSTVAAPATTVPPAPPSTTVPTTRVVTPPASMPQTSPGVRNEQVYEVKRGDTFWGLAEEHLGSGMRWREIRDRNVGRAVAPGRTMAHGEDRIDVGWRIILPTTAPASTTTPQLNSSLPQQPMTAPASEAPPGTMLSELEELEAQLNADTPAMGVPGARRDAGDRVTAEQAAADEAALLEADRAAEAEAERAAVEEAQRVAAEEADRVAAAAAESAAAEEAERVAAAVAAPPGGMVDQRSAAPNAPAPVPEPELVPRSRPTAETAARSTSGAIPLPAAAAGQQVSTLTVEPGDHFWGIAERQLEQAWGRPVSAAEIAPYWRTIIDANRSRIVSGDPDVIFPGQSFTAPVTPTSPEGAPPPAVPPVDEAPPDAPPPADEPPPDEAPADEAPPDEAPSDEAPPEESDDEQASGNGENERSAAEEPPPAQVPPDTTAPATSTSDTPPTTQAPVTTAPPPPPTTAPPPPTTAAPAPPTTARPPAPTPPTTEDDDEGAPGVGVPGGASPTTTAPEPEVLPGGGTSTPSPPETTEPPGSATTAPGDTSGNGDGSGDEQAVDVGDDEDDSAGVPLAAVAGTAALAGLVLVALARRRRARSRSLRPGGHVEPRLVADILTERQLSIAAGDVLDVVWATSRALGAVLAVKEDLPAVTAVLVGPNRAVTVHFAEPCDPAPPFEVGAATDRWQLYLDDLDEVDLVSGPEPAVAVLDTLTVLGQTDADEWLFVDLESLGAVELAGDPVVAAELAQSIVTELTLQPASDHLVDLTVIGVDELSPSVAEQGVANVAQLDQELVRRFEQSADETSGFLDIQGLRSTAAARAKGMARDGLFVTVVAYGGATPADPVLLERLAAAATPGGRGVAVVAFGPLGAGATRVIVHDDGRAHIPRLGITVNAARLERGDLERISDLLANEPETVESGDDSREWVVPGAGVRDTVEPGPPRYESVPPVPVPDLEPDYQGEPAAPGAAEFGPDVTPDYLEPLWRYCVRIFADHMVETPEGEVVSFRYGDNPDVPNKNTHRGPELLAYLALSGRAASATDVRDHLWWDRPVALGTVNKLLYGTRKVLGGADLLSLAQDDPVGRYRLSLEVVTDVEMLAHALQHAHSIAQMYPDVAIDILRGQLAQIETVAFRSGHLGQGLAEWAAAYRVVDRVEQPVIDAALLVAKLSTDRGPDGYDEALWAVDQGLFACPVNEALVRAAMEIEARLGSTDAVNARYLTLAAKLARDELEPEPETIDLRARLGGGKGSRGGRNGIR